MNNIISFKLNNQFTLNSIVINIDRVNSYSEYFIKLQLLSYNRIIITTILTVEDILHLNEVLQNELIYSNDIDNIELHETYITLPSSIDISYAGIIYLLKEIDKNFTITFRYDDFPLISIELDNDNLKSFIMYIYKLHLLLPYS